MITLRTFIEQEHPRINAALAEAAAELPVSIMPIAQYAMGNGGKRLRPLLTVLVARLLGYADNDIYPLAAAMEMFHVATLLHDDVMDNAEMRRGSTATHKVFGVTETILAGDALLAKGNQIVAGFGDPRLTAATSDAIAQTANGEILEIANQGKNAPDLLIYNQIIAGKTAWMIRTSCNIGALRANGTPEQVAGATDYGFNLGMAFQIVDDALDFAPSSLTGKPEGGDVREGKLTPPIFFYANSLAPAERDAFFARFAEQSFTDEDVRHVIDTSPPDFRPRRTGKSLQALSATSATATPDFFHATFFHGYSNSLFRRQTCSTALKPAFSPILTTRSAVKPQPASVKPSASPSSPCARSKCSRWRGSTRNR